MGVIFILILLIFYYILTLSPSDTTASSSGGDFSKKNAEDGVPDSFAIDENEEIEYFINFENTIFKGNIDCGADFEGFCEACDEFHGDT